MSLSGTWSSDTPTPRPTPDEITARAERYLKTRAVSCYGDLNHRELQEFWAETARLKRIHGLGAWRTP